MIVVIGQGWQTAGGIMSREFPRKIDAVDR